MNKKRTASSTTRLPENREHAEVHEPNPGVSFDLRPITFLCKETASVVRKNLFPGMTEDETAENFYEMYESSEYVEPRTNDDWEESGEAYFSNATTTTAARSAKRRRHSPATVEDKRYRSDREYLKRHSHANMIWFFRNVGLRHPAAVRNHLEKVKQPDFEIPNLQCVYPHSELEILFDDVCAESCGSKPKDCTKFATNNTYYQIYCATDGLVNRVKKALTAAGVCKGGQNGNVYKKRILLYVADIVGRLLWHNNRSHTVMFAKSDHYDRGCFLLFGRQAEPAPFMMRSDSYFCRRHDSEKYRCRIMPQPDLTRSELPRLANESALYIVGCDVTELWDSFLYDYRITGCRNLKALCDRIRGLDGSVVENTFRFINMDLNGDRENSPYVELASKTSFDVLSVFLRDTDVRETATDDSPVYRDFLERFITVGLHNLKALERQVNSTGQTRRDYNNREQQSSPAVGRLGRVVLHHVNYRRESRQLRTNRVFYYRNEENYVCCMSLLEDFYPYRKRCHGVPSHDELGRDRVYFYDILQPFEYNGVTDVNELVLKTWDDAQTLIHESTHTIRQRFTATTNMAGLPQDRFYPKSDMSVNDMAIDRILERAIKYSKSIHFLPVPRLPEERDNSKRYKSDNCNVDATLSCVSNGVVVKNTRGKTGVSGITGRHNRKASNIKRKLNDGETDDSPSTVLQFVLAPDEEISPGADSKAVTESFSKLGPNRLAEGYRSPTFSVPLSDSVVKLDDGQSVNLKLAVIHGGVPEQMTPVDYGQLPEIGVSEGELKCVYTIEPPSSSTQIRMVSGSALKDTNHPKYLRLQETDRVVRVFNIRATGPDSYVVCPYTYFVFRNMPVSEFDDSLMEELSDAYRQEHRSQDSLRRPPSACHLPEYNTTGTNQREHSALECLKPNELYSEHLHQFANNVTKFNTAAFEGDQSFRESHLLNNHDPSYPIIDEQFHITDRNVETVNVTQEDFRMCLQDYGVNLLNDVEEEIPESHSTFHQPIFTYTNGDESSV